MDRHILLVLAIVLAGDLVVEAQTAASDPKPPIVDARAAQTLQVQAAGYLASIAVLQEKVDAIESQFQREAAKLQQQCAAVEGYQLGPQLTCVKKSEKKDGAAPKGGGGGGN